MTRPAPPTGATPPAQVLTAEGVAIELRPLAREICPRDLEIAGDVVLTSHVLGALAKPTSEIFADAAAAVSALRQIP